MSVDLNCDLGETEAPRVTAGLMRCVTSANIACGGHAGDVSSVRRCLRLAKRFKVRVGAHPGFPDKQNFGRARIALAAGELELLLLHQVSGFEKLATDEGLELHHIKLHGALYHAVEESPLLAREYISAIKRWWPKTKIYARSGGAVAKLPKRWKVAVWEEIFADRQYSKDGALVARDRPGALIHSGAECERRLEKFLRSGKIETANGEFLKLSAQTVCLHSDTPNALNRARRIYSLLQRMRQLDRPG